MCWKPTVWTPTTRQIRNEWVDHLNHDIWVSTRAARDLMDGGIVPPATGSAALNPEGVWSMDAQLETELFGLIAPGMPNEAMRRARYYARITNSGPAVEVSAFYASMYADAFFEDDVPQLISAARTRFPADGQVNRIVDQVVACYSEHPRDWRLCRRKLALLHDDPEWWAAKINFAMTIMALLYGDGDLEETLTIAALAGWDADNNMTTSAGLLGIILGHRQLPKQIQQATDLYYNEDVTGDLPRYDSLNEIARRTQRLGEQAIRAAGGETEATGYLIPITR